MRRLLILVALAIGACAEQPPGLHADRNADGTVYLAPWCQDRASLRALKVSVLRVPRDNAALHPHGIDADGRWLIPGVIVVRDDLRGWVAEDVEDHERCHELTYRLTGSPVFHR